MNNMPNNNDDNYKNTNYNELLYCDNRNIKNDNNNKNYSKDQNNDIVINKCKHRKSCSEIFKRPEFIPKLAKKSIEIAENLESSFNRLTKSKNISNINIETDRNHIPKINDNSIKIDFKK